MDSPLYQLAINSIRDFIVHVTKLSSNRASTTVKLTHAPRISHTVYPSGNNRTSNYNDFQQHIHTQVSKVSE